MAGSDWPEDHYSTVTSELQAEGQNTRLDATQTDTTEDHYAKLERGGVQYCWDNLMLTLAKRFSSDNLHR